MPNELDFTINEAAVVPVPVDATLSIEGQAADAKAVGDALADKADKSELATAITVNGQAADAQGAILVTAEHVPMDDNESETVAQAIATQAARTGEDIPINGSTGAVSIEAALDAKVDEVIAELGGDPIPLEHGGTGATSAAGVKVVLGLQSAGQGVNILQPTGNGQVLSLLANVTNSSSILDGHRVTLLIQDNAIRLYDVTIGENVWQLPVPVGVAQGGTGATSGPAALANLGIATPMSMAASVCSTVLPSSSNTTVPLRQIAKVQPKWSESRIMHRGGERCITVCGSGDRRRAGVKTD